MKNNNFQRKLNRAKWVEKKIWQWYRKNKDKTAVRIYGYFTKYNIKTSDGNLEIKEDLLACKTGNYAIEYKNINREPSGLFGTTAKTFVLVDDEYVIFIKTDTLKHLIKTGNYKKIDMGNKRQGKNCSRGYLVRRGDIIYSPYAIVMKRWF